MGQIITFYSYKGGTGRTMALANVAVLLSRWGYRVLMVDWDLEAPGLEYFFKQFLDLKKAGAQKGIVEIITENAASETGILEEAHWRDFLIEFSLPENKMPLYLLTAGKRDESYFSKVRKLDIRSFYTDNKGGVFIESLRDEWKEEFDFVLIDSRTGVTDIGGVCTIQLPDVLALLFTAMEQAIVGIVDIAKKAYNAHQNLPIDRLKLVSLPVPSRFDFKEEYATSKKWLDRFSEELTEIYTDWLPATVDPKMILEVTKLPYIPFFSFGEKLPVLEQGTNEPTGLGYAYANIGALLANNLENIEILLDDRHQYIRMAQRKKLHRRPRILISYSHKDEAWVNTLLAHIAPIKKHATLDIWDDRKIDSSGKWFSDIKKAIENASISVCLVSAHYLASAFCAVEEIPYMFERQEEQGMVILPILVRPCLWESIPWMKKSRMLPRDGKALSKLEKNDMDTGFREVAQAIFNIVNGAE